ncbi:Mycothiol S-conjugate amidase [Metallosphaera sp. J1]|nr:PIG-L family deacetylase [Metallosphaera javensis (ex Hofmann et al. 2022)]MCG3109440.1 Mycothiol S-conjugate amidase [Metallosphaera javensis (ex Hofmann et al. 2022)]
MARKLLLIGAHLEDMVWRASVTVAKYLKQGNEVALVALTFGKRGES